MTKKHFIALADAIKDHNSYASESKFTGEQIRVLAAFCKNQNYQFDRDRWLDYISGECGPLGGRIKNAK